MRKFAYVWEYRVDDSHKSDFLDEYDSTGTWAQLFQKDSNYLETVLLVDDTNPDRFMTIDYWTSKRARDDFRARFRTEFDALDDKCEAFTRTEVFLGDFVVVSSSDA